MTTPLQPTNTHRRLHRAASAGSPVPNNTAESIRVVTLERAAQKFGLTVRGGAEHGLGHFVSAVEPGSPAHFRGLRAGDCILRVDGLALSGATHREAVALIASRGRKVKLEVRAGGGVVPVKARSGDPITWIPAAENESLETRVVISIPGVQGLGCAVCKGPPDNPGIFVQSTRPGGLACAAGLKPGDEIVDCNGANLRQLSSFGEAVARLKSSRHLDLLIRKGAGADLFPTEAAASSGYDSSSGGSSDDHQLCARLSQSASDLTLSNRPADVAETRIRLEEKLIEEERRRLEEEQERLRREAQKLEAERRRFEEEKMNAQRPNASSVPPPPSSNSNGSSNSSSSSNGNNGLKGAIQSELQRRRAAKQRAPEAPNLAATAPNSITRRKTPHLATLKNEKHDALMAEFKRAHRKMFKQSNSDDDDDRDDDDDDSEEKDKDVEEEAEHSESSHSSKDLCLTTEEISIPCCNSASSSSSVSPISTMEDNNESNKILSKPKLPPPPPPERSSSMSPPAVSTSSPKPTKSVMLTKPAKAQVAKKKLAYSPGIPTPDYDSTPDLSPRLYVRRRQTASATRQMASRPRGLRQTNSLGSLVAAQQHEERHRRQERSNKRISPRPGELRSAQSFSDLSFGLRHSSAPAETPTVSLDSFTPAEGAATLRRRSQTTKPPPFYFDKSNSAGSESRNSLSSSLSSNGGNCNNGSGNGPISPFFNDRDNKKVFDFRPSASKSVRFTLGEEGRVASHDYRAQNAASAASAVTEMALSLSRRNRLTMAAATASGSSSTSSEEELGPKSPSSSQKQPPPRRGARSPKKMPPPPPNMRTTKRDELPEDMV